MDTFTIQIVQLVNGGKSPFDGQYLVEYDPTRPGRTPAGRPMNAHIRCTREQVRARRFPDQVAALEYWRKESPAGDRPLTAFNVLVEPLEPTRIQRLRTKGWTMPDGVVDCSRPHLFGNPFVFETETGLARVPAADMVTPWEYEGRISAAGMRHDMHWPGGHVTQHTIRYMTHAEIVATHRRALIAPTSALRLFHHRTRQQVTVDLVRAQLAGRILACWCPLNRPCHVDTLLWVANAPDTEIKEAVDAEYEIIRQMAERVGRLHPQVLAEVKP